MTKSVEISDDAKALLALCENIDGVDIKEVRKYLTNESLVAEIVANVRKAGLWNESCVKAHYIAIHHLSVKSLSASDFNTHKEFVLGKIASGGLASTKQVDAALKYLIANGDGNEAAFNAACGIGVVITEDDIRKAVNEVIATNQAQLVEERYHCNTNIFLAKIKGILPWGDAKVMGAILTEEIEALLGPKTEADLAPPPKKKKEKKKTAAAAATGDAANANAKGNDAVVEKKEEIASIAPKFPKPQDNTQNSPEKLAEHLATTGGIVITRFPPEPNGYLHIGHAKSMQLNFGFAEEAKGKCILRFDDTNPASEDQEYIDSILANLKWLGYEPWKITYSSDYFQELHDFAVKMIHEDLAYIDESSAEVIREGRQKMIDSPYRNRPKEESLSIFAKMIAGELPEGVAVLRIKGDMKHDCAVMRDFIAYRVKKDAHHRTGTKWGAYPSYDFTHCVVDALENVTHSLCTLEFDARRVSYFWLLDVLGLYKPVVWEFSRLNVSNTVVSKRKLKALVEKKVVDGWDDPRLFTLASLRRRGFTPAIIKDFCARVGVTRNENVISYLLLEACARNAFDVSAVRRMGIVKPLRVEFGLEGGAESLPLTVTMPNHPKNASMNSREVTMTQPFCYLSLNDWKDVDEDGYYGLAPGKRVLLRYLSRFLTVPADAKLEVDGESGIPVLRGGVLSGPAPAGEMKKCKGVLHWVDGASAQPCRIRSYSLLFPTPSSSEGDDNANANAEAAMEADANSCVETAGMVEAACMDGSVAVGDVVQFEREGFFTREKEDLFSLCVSLRESKEKKTVR